jgi:cytochrome c peroxidase
VNKNIALGLRRILTKSSEKIGARLVISLFLQYKDGTKLSLALFLWRNPMKHARLVVFGLLLMLAASCGNSEAPKKDETAAPPPAAPTVLKVQTGIEDMEVPADNPMTPEKIELGKMLFFDKRLGKDGKMSCETCHLPEKGWTDAKQFSIKADGTANTRHTPTLYNVGFYKEWYWDGRSATLEAQIQAAWKNQMGADMPAVAMTLNGIEGYKTAFQSAMGGEATPDSVVKALATFVRTIRSEDSPWDKYEKNDKTAVSKVAVAGFEVFRSDDKAQCGLCHTPPLYTDKDFHNIGIGFDKDMPDQGRGKILADKKDPAAEAKMGAFKTPTLRSVAETGPYFHDGRAKTLDEAVTLLLKGGIDNPHKDEKLKERKITAPEKAALIEFMKALSPAPMKFERPKLP